MKRVATGIGTFRQPCGCRLQKTAHGHAWKQCDLHKAAPAMLKVLDRVLFARRTGDGGGIFGWDLFYECGKAVNKANQRWTDTNLRKCSRRLQNEIAQHKHDMALLKSRRSVKARAETRVGNAILLRLETSWQLLKLNRLRFTN